MSGSGIGEDGVWTPVWPRQRPPFAVGNDLHLVHGAYATVALGPRVDELAEGMRPLVPGYSPSDEPAVRLLSLTMARLERAEAVLEQAEPSEAGRLRSDALGWANAARRLLNDLGLTPTSRARLGLDVAATERALSVLDYYRGRELESRAVRGAPDLPPSRTTRWTASSIPGTPR